jgi:transcriptional antiterminator RfaH
MNVWLDSNWFAVNTKQHQEETAAFNIKRLGVEVLLPKISSIKSMLGTTRPISSPMFPCYLFAQFSPERFLHSIRYARGVRRVVSAGDVPVPVDSSIISSIQSRIDTCGFVELTPHEFSIGAEVLIQEGSLRGLTGVFERELSGQKRVVILLKSLEYQAHVFVEKRFLSSVPETV